MVLKKLNNAGEFSISAQYRIPYSDCELGKTTIRIWDETDSVIITAKILKKIDPEDLKLDLLISKEDIKKVLKLLFTKEEIMYLFKKR